MIRKISKGLCMLSLCGVLLNTANVLADSRNISQGMPKSGWVEMDNSGKVIKTNLRSAPKSKVTVSGVHNYSFGRWVYYVERFPDVPLGQKASNSNFRHFTRFHWSTAAVGGNNRTGYASAGEWSVACAVGPSSSVAKAFYNW